jgi:hypothetical protein
LEIRAKIEAIVGEKEKPAGECRQKGWLPPGPDEFIYNFWFTLYIC